MKIDRERFLVLVVALGAPACAGVASTGNGEPPSAPLVIAPLASTNDGGGVSALAVDVAPPEPPPPPVLASACEKENDVGEVDCAKLKKLGLPTCEGIRGVCDLLAKGVSYRPRAAAAAAACFAKLGARACDTYARRRCYEEGVKAACPEPQYAAACDAKIDMCRQAGVKVQYTKEDCMRSMSSQHKTDRDWAISAMGPSSEGKCQLMFTVF